MIRGINTAMQSMKVQLARQELLARNVANLATPGYKQETGALDSFSIDIGRSESPPVEGKLLVGTRMATLGSLGLEVALARPSVDFGQGRLEQTNRSLDVALAGDGFIQVLTPEGDFLSRGGALSRDSEGRLVTSEGYSVLGADGGEIFLSEGDVSIVGDGTISIDGQPFGAISVVEFDPGTLLTKVGEGLYTPEDPLTGAPAVASNTVVRQGFLESSNVDAVAALTEMVSLLRVYQASQRLVQAEDELLGKAVNEVGRI